MSASLAFGAAVMLPCGDCGATMAAGLTVTSGENVLLHSVPVCDGFEKKTIDSMNRDIDRLLQTSREESAP